MKILISFISSQTTYSFINLFPVLLIPAAIIGFQIYYRYRAFTYFLHLLQHIKHIKKTGFLEHILATTAQHRYVISSTKYMDMKHSPFFII
jgi:hypothetical protein